MDKQQAIENRYLLTSAFNRFAGGTEASNAELLVEIAVRNVFLPEPRPLSGTSFKNWAKNKKAPEWACKAAVAFLVENGYLPNKFTEKLAMAHTIVSMNPNSTSLQIKEKIGAELFEVLSIDQLLF